MNFLLTYLGEKRGGGALMHVCMGTHSQPLLQNRWMFTKLGKDEVLMAQHMHKDVWPYLPRADAGRGKNRSRGIPFFKNLFFRPEGYTNKPNS